MNLELNGWPVVVVIFATLGFIAFIAGSAMLASGEVTYCYVDRWNEKYYVKGHRDWKQDAVVGVTDSAENADSILRQSALCSKK